MTRRHAWRAAAVVAVIAAVPYGSVMIAGPLFSARQNPAGFPQLFDEYRHGDADHAIGTFAMWDRGRIEREARLADPRPDPWPLAALALFHSEAWLRQGPGAKAHHEAAVRLMSERVCPFASGRSDARVLAFCRDWYAVILIQGEFLGQTKDFLRDDAKVQLVRGAWAEFWMGPVLESGGGADSGFLSEALDGPFTTTSHGRFGRATADAQSSLERALKLDPMLAEARVRLGRVLFLLDRREAARQELERALKDAAQAQDAFSGYLAAMFLGQLHEEGDRVEDALASYRRAVSVDPRFPGAPLAIARLLAATGRPAEASSTIEAFFRGLQSPGTSAIDPWTEYPRGRAYWHRGQILRALREVVRQ